MPQTLFQTKQTNRAMGATSPFPQQNKSLQSMAEDEPLMQCKTCPFYCEVKSQHDVSPRNAGKVICEGHVQSLADFDCVDDHNIVQVRLSPKEYNYFS